MRNSRAVNGRAGSDLERELRAVVDGEVRFDDYTRFLYATDASMYEVEPIGVVLPRSEADIHAVLELANRYNVPVLPRGGGTSLAGQTVNRAVVLDFSKFLNRVLEVNTEERWCRVQPGLVQDELNAHVGPLGLLFGPDTSTSNRASGAAWYSHVRAKERERVRLEEARIALEAEKLKQRTEIEQARLIETQTAREQQMDYARQTDSQFRSERERIYTSIERQQEAARAYQQQARDGTLKTYDERTRQQKEDRDRRLAEEDRRKAQAEVERQKRFVAEREREEERIRADKHYRAQREAEEIKRREAEEKRKKNY